MRSEVKGESKQEMKRTNLAEEIILAKGKLIAAGQLFEADDTAKASNMIDLIASSHHQITFGEAQRTFGTFCAKKPGKKEKTKQEDELVSVT